MIAERILSRMEVAPLPADEPVWPAPLQQAPVILSGARCKCTACGEYFNSDYAFSKHRVGRHSPMERRCLSPDEMLGKGMCLVGRFWASKRRAPQTIPLDAIPSKTGTHSSVVMAEAVASSGVGHITGKTRSWRYKPCTP